MKISLKLKGPSPRDYACKGRPPKCASPGAAAPGVCYRVRSEGEGDRKTHMAELVSTRTGNPIGYIGVGCTVVSDPALARRSNYLNKMNAEWDLYSCLQGYHGDKKAFKASLKAALKKEKLLK